MPRYPSDDLFAESTMSFGEHLEELRTALAKSVLALVLFFIIGLCVGEYIVQWIQTPLTGALKNHLIASAIADVKREYQEQGSELSKDLEDFLIEQEMVFDRVYVEAAEVDRVARVLGEVRRAKLNAAGKEPPAPAEAPPKPAGKATDAADASSPVPLERPGGGEAADTADASSRVPPERPGGAEAADTADVSSPVPRGRPGGGEAADTPDADKPSAESSLAEPVTDPSAAPAPVAMAEKFLGGKPLPPKRGFVETRVWRPIRAVMKTLSAQEAFMIYLKAAFVAGLVMASPYIFWQIWAFVAAGLYPHEKRYVHIYLPFSLGLFLAGAALAFFGVFPYILQFLFAFNKAMNIDPDPRISEWMSFVLLMPLGFGISFQLPLVMLFLNRIGLFSIQAYASKWRIAVLVVFVLAAVLTPSPDPVSMLMLALPMTGLYFLGMGLCKWMPRNKNPFREAYEP